MTTLNLIKAAFAEIDRQRGFIHERHNRQCNGYNVITFGGELQSEHKWRSIQIERPQSYITTYPYVASWNRSIFKDTVEKTRRLNVMFDVMSNSDTRDQFELGIWRIHMTNLPTTTERKFGFKLLDELILTAYERQDYRTARWLENTLKFAMITDAYYPRYAYNEESIQKLQRQVRFWGFFGYTFNDVAPKIFDYAGRNYYANMHLTQYPDMQMERLRDERDLMLEISATVYTQAIQNGNYAVASAAAHVHDVEIKFVGTKIVTRL